MSIGLWRKTAVQHPHSADAPTLPTELIFPSGRQALSHAIHWARLGRAARVAIPEWSSHCVISSVGQIAMPIPMADVIRHKISIQGVLIYEQWGWPCAEDVESRIRSRFADCVIIKDMVDSAHFTLDEEPGWVGFPDFIRIFSLAKVLGLTGGGIASTHGSLLSFAPAPSSRRLADLLEWNDTGTNPADSLGDIRTLMKEYCAAVPSSVLEWLARNDLFGAVRTELTQRHQNLRTVLASSITDDWPGWMRSAIDAGAGPGIAPVFRDGDVARLQAKMRALRETAGVETQIYHFNWSGDPLLPAYARCLSLPVHGEVTDIDYVLTVLGKG